MLEQYVLDVTNYKEGDPFCFIPIENMGKPDERLVTGLNFLCNIESFNQGEIIGIVHLDGQPAVDKFCEVHPEIVEQLKKKVEKQHEIYHP